MKQSKKLPIGIQDFEKLITVSNLYIDKTDYIYELASNSRCYFLSRPRRFGKSLMLSTLKAYFQGKKELFKGLKIEKIENQWEKHPVFYIDLVGITTEGASITDTLNEKLENILSKFEKQWGVIPSSKSVSIRLLDLLQKATNQSGKKAVVLVDEYDKPLLESLNDPKRYNEVKQILRSFYSVFKEGDQYLRFVMLTGVSKFSGLSIFSDLNNLDDISMNRKFHAICGITLEELNSNLNLELKELADLNSLTYDQIVFKMREFYDGYRFNKNSDALFNPFSVLNCLDRQSFGYYWFQSGTPTFLVERMQKINFNISNLVDGIEVNENQLSDYRVGETDLIPLLYQSGYLTIKPNNTSNYLLKFPNKEVQIGFFNNLSKYIHPNFNNQNEFAMSHFINDFKNGDMESFMKKMKSFIASIPSSTPPKTENDYRDIIYLLFALMGEDVQSEVASCLGRSDIVVKADEFIYLFEIKYANTFSEKLLHEAMKQIDDKGYLVPFVATDLKLIKIAAVFSNEDRTVAKWLIA